MFNVNDNIIYGNVGVCCVKEIIAGSKIGMNSEKVYYKLYSYGESEIIYIPIDTKISMRLVMTKEKIKKLIRSLPQMETSDFDSNNLRLQAEHYKSFLENCDSENMLKLIKTIYSKKLEREKAGKKAGVVETMFMKEAQQKLHGEIAVALGIKVDEVPELIERELSKVNSN